jgi:hypothetical protein
MPLHERFEQLVAVALSLTIAVLIHFYRAHRALAAVILVLGAVY